MGDVTIDGSAFGGEIMRGYFRVRSSNVIFRELRIRTGDPLLTDDYGTANPILLTGTAGPVRNILIDHVSLMWATEMNLAIYDDVADVTVQNSIMAEGLQYTHQSGPQVYEHDGWHSSRCLNITTKKDGAWPKRITFYRNLTSSCTYRVPQIFNAENLDWVNNVIYNGGKWSMHGNPRGLNYVSSVVRSGPDSGAGGKMLFRSYTSEHSPVYFMNSVYMHDVLADGFPATNMSFATGVRRTTPYGGGLYNIPLIDPATAVLSRIAAVAGPTDRDGTDWRVIKSMLNRTSSGIFNASYELGGPKPVW
jgi:hypothetical protein